VYVRVCSPLGCVLTLVGKVGIIRGYLEGECGIGVITIWEYPVWGWNYRGGLDYG